jgi:predicted O-methyltransferase YrrM
MTVRKSLRNLYRRLLRYRIFQPVHFAHRMTATWITYVWPNVRIWIVWLFRSRENANFTYAVTERCQIYFATGLSAILGESPEVFRKFMNEIQEDHDFNRHIRSLQWEHPLRYRTDPEPSVGRRMVWYAIVRMTKPALVLETGVDQGLGAVVLCTALKRNAAEGHPGRYVGIDNDPQAGYFLKGDYATFGSLMYGDSLESLRTLNNIDVFINDSDHNAEYELAEYETIKDKVTARAVILSDNAHATAKLAEFSMRNGRRFIFLAEEPANHWYRGGGIGVSVPPSLSPRQIQ